jgi:16S rRNA (guanine(966)-N(2))-methyltransferase RsmD
MRVIAGHFRSRKLKPVPGMNVRPTPDRLREALFNVLQTRIGGTVFLDAYAGTGAVGIEALSRGASHIVLIEKRADALAVIRENLRSLQIEQEATVVRGAALAVLGNQRCDIAFVDPPYEKVNEYSECLSSLDATGCTLAIAQHDCKLELAEAYGPFRKLRTLRQGDNSLSFYERA